MPNRVEIDFEANTSQAANNIRQLDRTFEDLGGRVKRSGLSLTDIKSGIDLTVGALRTLKQAGEQAFQFGKEGAQIAQTTESFARLMQNVGVTGDLLGDLRTASSGTISDMKLMSATTTLLAGAQGELATNLALATPELLEIAKAANKLNPTLGDTTFLYESLATGVKRASPMILDNLGLTIKIGQANETYAKSIGKTVSELTAEEQKQALLNETLRAGKVLIEQAGGAADNAVDSYARWEAATENLTNQAKTLAGSVLGPLVEASAHNVETVNFATDAYRRGSLTLGQYAATLLMTNTPLGVFTDEMVTLKEIVAKTEHNQASLNRETAIAAAYTRDYGQEVEPVVESTRKLTALNNSTAAYYRTVVEGATEAGEAQRLLAESTERMQAAALSAGLSGALTSAFEDYDKVLSETTPRIAELRGEIEKYTKMQGQSVTVTGQATTSSAEYELAAIRAAEAARKASEYTGDSREEYLQLVVAAEQAQERVVKLGEGMGTSETFTLNYTQKLAELNTELDANIAKNEAAALAMKESIAQFLYQQLAVEGDTAANLELARTLGIIDEASYNAALAAQALREEYQQTGDLSNYRNETDLLQQAIEKLRSRDITITVTTINRAINEIVETAAVIAEGEHYGDANTGAVDTTGDYYDAPGYEPGRAHGGPVSAGMPYWVGEHGPERFVPATDGQIVPAGEGLPTVTIENFYGAPNMDVRAVAAQFSAALAAQLRGTLGSGAYRMGA